MAGNLATTLMRKRGGNPMRAYDALPTDLRQWLAAAVLPWNPKSVRRVWFQAIKNAQGDTQAARAALSALERRRLERDVARIWGNAHPYLKNQPLLPSDQDQGLACP